MSQPSGVGMTASKGALQSLRARADRNEVISAGDIGATFVWMRPDDLVWRYAINNWFLGQPPPAFDVLHWNNDGQGLPSRLALELGRMSLDNSLARPDGMTLFGQPVDLSKITTDTYAIAGQTDHISSWRACYTTRRLLGGHTEFVLTPTGHVQSIIYPPTNPKAAFLTGSEESAKNLTLTAAATHLGVWPARIGELELGRRPNDELAGRYRTWLKAA